MKQTLAPSHTINTTCKHRKKDSSKQKEQRRRSTESRHNNTGTQTHRGSSNRSLTIAQYTRYSTDPHDTNAHKTHHITTRTEAHKGQQHTQNRDPHGSAQSKQQNPNTQARKSSTSHRTTGHTIANQRTKGSIFLRFFLDLEPKGVYLGILTLDKGGEQRNKQGDKKIKQKKGCF